jgi:hypothetical protein
MKQTAVEWLAEKYDYAYWMLKRDEISPVLAEEWKKHYLQQAKEMEKEQMEKTWVAGLYCETGDRQAFIDYYNETFKSE